MAVDFISTWSGFSVRVAEPRDERAIRLLLPGMHADAWTLLATDNHHRRIVAAAAMTNSCRPQPLVGPGVALHVIEPCRRRGIARSLLQRLEEVARQRFHATGLYAASRVERDSAEMFAWQRLRFNPLETVMEHALPIADFEPRLGPLFERLQHRGHIPAGAQIIPLYRANPAAVMQLHLDEMGGHRQELYRKLRGAGQGAFHPHYSRVLVVDDRVQGCLLAHRTAKYTAHIDANIIAPALRGKWANVWLKLEAARRALKLGIREFTYTSFDHYTDTRSFSDQFAGRILRTMFLMARHISEPPQSRHE